MRAAVCTYSFFFVSFLGINATSLLLVNVIGFCSIYLDGLEFQICDMVAVARLLNLTLVVPELDKTSFWADPRYVYYS